MKHLLLFIMISIVTKTNAQPSKDSLFRIWNNKKLPDTVRLSAVNTLAWDVYLFVKPDSAYILSEWQLKLSQKIKHSGYIAKAYNTQGVSLSIRGYNDQAIHTFEKCLAVYKKVKNKEGMAKILGNIGLIYKFTGNYAQSIQYMTNGLKIQENINDITGQANTLANIAAVYEQQSDHKKAIHLYLKSLRLIKKTTKPEGIGSIYNNLGMMYHNLNKTDSAIHYLKKSEQINSLENNQYRLASTYINLGTVFESLQQHDSAIYYYQKSEPVFDSMNDVGGKISVMIHLANSYLKQGKTKQSLSLSSKAYELADQGDFMPEKASLSSMLYEGYKKTKDYKKAMQFYEIHIQIRDSLESEANQKEIIRQEYKYQYEKRAAADSVVNAKQQEIKNAEIARQKAEIKAKRNQQFLLFGGLGLVFIFALFMYNRFKVTARQKKEIEKQKLLVEEKQKEILDSIRYAKRIQMALLPSDNFIDKQLKIKSR